MSAKTLRPASLFLAGLSFSVFCALSFAKAATPKRTDRPLLPTEAAIVQTALTLMHERGLTDEAALGHRIQQRGLWRAATPDDPYMHDAEKAGDTPFAYTLPENRRPVAIVLAPRFFSDTTPTARAAVLIHEMAHYRAYYAKRNSDEFDGYKAEYDTHTKLGLTEADGLTYFAMLDGVAEYVVPRLPEYKTFADVKAYMTEK